MKYTGNSPIVSQFVAVARRPLRVEELAELVAFDFKFGSMPKFYEDRRLEDPRAIDTVLSTCPSLLAVVDVNGSHVIQFSHFSVKEFLTSARVAEASDNSRRCHIDETSAHTLAAQACLGILLHLDEDVTRKSLGKKILSLNMLRSIGLTMLVWRMRREMWMGRNNYSTQANHTLRSVSGYTGHTIIGGIESNEAKGRCHSAEHLWIMPLLGAYVLS